MPTFREIPQFVRAHHQVDVAWVYLEETLESWGSTEGGMGGIDLSPDYQREHVWTRKQQIAYVEYQLQGGEVGKAIVWNSPDWMGSWKRPTELVDGKQRLEAVRSFMRNEFPVFGYSFSDFTDRLDQMLTFKFRVCKLPDARRSPEAVPQHQRRRHAAHQGRARPSSHAPCEGRITMKVYSWQGLRRGTKRGGITTREIVCAASKREARALQGSFKVPLVEILESSRPKEIEIATSRPGVVFWRDVDDFVGDWTASEPKKEGT